MIPIFDLLFGFIKSILSMLGSFTISFGGSSALSTNYLAIIFAIIIISICISVFWKGGKG